MTQMKAVRNHRLGGPKTLSLDKVDLQRALRIEPMRGKIVLE